MIPAARIAAIQSGDRTSRADLATVLELADAFDLPIAALDASDDPAVAAQLASRLPENAATWRLVLPMPSAGLADLAGAPTLNGSHGGA